MERLVVTNADEEKRETPGGARGTGENTEGRGAGGQGGTPRGSTDTGHGGRGENRGGARGTGGKRQLDPRLDHYSHTL